MTTISPMETHSLRKWFIVHFDYNPLTGIFTNRQSGLPSAKKTEKGYLRLKGPSKKAYYAHRIAYLIMEGQWPNQIDHRNRVRTDNRWENLMNADQFLNAQNHGLRKTNKSGKTGVSFCERYKWVAEITRFGKRKRVRGIRSMEEAIAIRESWENEIPKN